MRGKLVSLREGRPSLEVPGGKIVWLEGDADTRRVLLDERLQGEDFEARGESGGAGTFAILPIHLRALFVHRDGKRFMITYWCEVCAIRTYTPGVCACCQEEMALDLRAPGEP